ncbi:HIT family protein [Spectribacter hydrogenoxidans]|uniref:HIT family protein n=1 Tax=Spectribacter hydrogenoxidans TaxID=3075608 RepID=UPI0032C22C9E
MCPFCELPDSRIWHENEHFFVVKDAFPVCHCHSLVIARRHDASIFSLSSAECDDLNRMLRWIKNAIDELAQPSGYNLGVNEGRAAGQTVSHLHVHVIPRYPDDQPDPRGGVRWVLPEKAIYWE